MKERKALFNPQNESMLVPRPTTKEQKMQNVKDFYLKSKTSASELRKKVNVMSMRPKDGGDLGEY